MSFHVDGIDIAVGSGFSARESFKMVVVVIGVLRPETESVKTLFVVVAGCLLCVVCWPLAVLAIVLWPLIWLIALPFRLVSVTIEAAFALIKALLLLPARLIGTR
jgi:hypothetical protein